MSNEGPIDPRGLTVIEWTDSMVFPLLDLARPSRLDNPDAWHEWALQVIQSPMVSDLNPPDPRGYATWQEWAIRFNQVLQS